MRSIEQAFNDPICPGEPLEKTLGVCTDFRKMLLPDPMLTLRTGFRRPAGCQSAFVSRKELIVRLHEMGGDYHYRYYYATSSNTTPQTTLVMPATSWGPTSSFPRNGRLSSKVTKG